MWAWDVGTGIDEVRGEPRTDCGGGPLFRDGAECEGVTFVAGDFLGEYEDDGGFDGIIFCSALHDLPDVTRGLAKAAALLRPEGKMVLLHAQGCAHVMGQHKANPVLVKRGLPSAKELEVIGVELGLELIHAPAELGSTKDSDEGYLAILRKAA